ncbi:MAG: hypothetical protein DBY24_00870 [Prevotellaceae bacterium]|nr:MAG: hypothetical protein DBY24_00870 [Prevotellaceae bacterium]
MEFASTKRATKTDISAAHCAQKKTGHRTLEKTQGILQKIQAIYFKIQGTYFKISALYFSRKIASDFQQLTNGVFQAFKSRRNRVKNRRVPHPPAPIMPV